MSFQLEPQSSVLFVLAHPDDETLLAGALIATLVSAGHVVSVLCAAPGDDDRSSRLHFACSDLGVREVRTLRFQESEMWPVENSSPVKDDLSPRLATAPTSDISARIRSQIQDISPDVVITHSPFGDYGHVDHASVGRATSQAIKSINGGIRFYTLDWNPWMVRLNVRFLKLGRRNIRRMGPDGRFNLQTAVLANVGRRQSLSVAQGLKARRQASRHYEKEISRGPLPLRLLERSPLWFQKFFLGKARLRLVVDEVVPTRSE